MIDITKLTNMINGLKDKEIVVKEKHTINWKKVACVVGVIAAVAGVAYAIYRYFKKDYEDEFMDDFDENHGDWVTHQSLNWNWFHESIGEFCKIGNNSNVSQQCDETQCHQKPVIEYFVYRICSAVEKFIRLKKRNPEKKVCG